MNVFEIYEKIDDARALCTLLRNSDAPLIDSERIEIAWILECYIGMLGNLKVVGGPTC